MHVVQKSCYCFFPRKTMYTTKVILTAHYKPITFQIQQLAILNNTVSALVHF